MLAVYCYASIIAREEPIWSCRIDAKNAGLFPELLLALMPLEAGSEPRGEAKMKFEPEKEFSLVDRLRK